MRKINFGIENFKILITANQIITNHERSSFSANDALDLSIKEAFLSL